MDETVLKMRDISACLQSEQIGEYSDCLFIPLWTGTPEPSLILGPANSLAIIDPSDAN